MAVSAVKADHQATMAGERPARAEAVAQPAARDLEQSIAESGIRPKMQPIVMSSRSRIPSRIDGAAIEITTRSM